MKLAPYPKYKDSGIEWLGEIPEGWEVIPLRRIGKIVNGSTPESSNEDYWDGDIAWLTPDDLGKHHNKYITDSKRKITYKGYINCGTTIVPKDSLILSTRAPIGHLALSSLEVCFNQGCRGIIFQNNYSPSFYYYYFSTLKEVLNSYGQGTTFFELGANKLASINVVIPSLQEQTAIANFLDHKITKIDELIKKNEKLIELLKEKRQAIISHAVTKGIPPHPPLEKGGWGDLKMKDSGIEWIGETPEGWEVKRLKFNLQLLTEKTDRRENPVALENIESWLGRYKETESEFQGEGIAFEKGDILFGKLRPYLAKAWLAEFSGEAIGDFFVMRPSVDIDGRFAVYQILNNGFISIVDGSTFGAKMPRVSWDFMANLRLPTPPIEKQHAIADYLDRETGKIDKTIKKIQSQIEKLKEYRQAIIGNVVTGKLRVN